MAARLNIMGLPTLLFLDKYQGDNDNDDDNDKTEEEETTSTTASAVLKGRMEGALRKDSII